MSCRLCPVALMLALAGCVESSVSPERAIDVDVSTWATWTLPNASAVRPGPPPVIASAAEINEVVSLQAARTAVSDSVMRSWDGDPTSRWTRIAVERLDFYWPLLPDVRIATPARAA